MDQDADAIRVIFEDLICSILALCTAVKMAGHECGLIGKVTSDLKFEGLDPFTVFGGAVFLKVMFQVTEVMNGGGTVSLKESNNSLFAV